MTIQRPRQPRHDETGEDIPATEQPETPDYLVPVLVAFDDLNDAARHERVTALYCQGYRTAAIATMLDIPVRTVSRYIKNARYLLATESRADREEILLRAVESARALAAEAWSAYERDCQLQREILAGQHDRLRRRVTRLGRPPRHPSTSESPLAAHGEGAGGEVPGGEVPDGDLRYEEYERPRCTSQAARLLAVALAAQREVNRLQGLYEHVAPARQPVDINITGPVPDGAASAGPSPSESDQPNPASAARPDTASSDSGDALEPESAAIVSRSVFEPARTAEAGDEETDYQDMEQTRRAAVDPEETLSLPPHRSPSPQQREPLHASVGPSGPPPSGTVPAEPTEDESSFRKEIPIAENSATFGHVPSPEGQLT